MNLVLPRKEDLSLWEKGDAASASLFSFCFLQKNACSCTSTTQRLTSVNDTSFLSDTSMRRWKTGLPVVSKV
jgi:hypothetical protein